MSEKTISALANQIRGVSYNKRDLHDKLDENSIILLRANNIVEGKLNFRDVVYVDKSVVAADQYLKDGDILISASSGSKKMIGKAASFHSKYKCTFGAFCKVVRPHDDIKEFLSIYFQSAAYRREISHLALGANINNIRNEHINSLQVQVPDYVTRLQMIKVINKLQKIRDVKKQKLKKLDELIKARFVEMFGDPANPINIWAPEKLEKICILNPKKEKKLENDDLDVSFVPMSAVSEHGAIDTTKVKKYSEVKKGFTYFLENDVLFAKITPCMENGKGAVATGLKNKKGFGSTEFHVLRPIKGKSNPYWLYTLTSFQSFRKLAELNMTGSAGQKRVPIKFLQNYKVVVPPISLQNEFANFVQQVDKSKVAVQKSLDETQKLYDSLMQEYFG